MFCKVPREGYFPRGYICRRNSLPYIYYYTYNSYAAQARALACVCTHVEYYYVFCTIEYIDNFTAVKASPEIFFIYIIIIFAIYRDVPKTRKSLLPLLLLLLFYSIVVTRMRCVCVLSIDRLKQYNNIIPCYERII